ncbi:MAG: hypothetical protein ACFFB3_05245 [Candidatus Hodarchaeota archaeon]
MNKIQVLLNISIKLFQEPEMVSFPPFAINRVGRGPYFGQTGLQFATDLLVELEEDLGWRPTCKDVEKRFPGILHAIRRGEWVDYGIRKRRYNDLL